VLAESGAIVEYLLQRYAAPNSGFLPTDPDEKLDVTYWSHAAEGSVMPLLVMKKVFSRIVEQSPWVMKPVATGIASGVNKSFIQPGLKKQFELIESSLVKNKEKTGGEFMVRMP
jgi:glutathione S-transferase